MGGESIGVVILLLFFALIFGYLIAFQWVGKVALRNNRSVSGFKWLFFFAPLVAWAILLTIDKREPKTR